MIPFITIPKDSYNPIKRIVLLQEVSDIEASNGGDNPFIRFKYIHDNKVDYFFETEALRDTQLDSVLSYLASLNGSLGCHISSGGISESFETVHQNLDSSNAVSSTETQVTYANGVIKTFSEPDENTIIITLSGSTPSGIDLVKTVTFSGDNLPTISYT